MKRLQKQAWKDVVILSFLTLVMCFAFYSMVLTNAKGIHYLFICIIVGIPVGIFTILKQIKIERDFDERERHIRQKAGRASNWTFVSFMGIVSFSVFLLIGGKGAIPVWVFPVSFIVGNHIAGCVGNFTLLIQCSRENDNSIEGGAA